MRDSLSPEGSDASPGAETATLSPTERTNAPAASPRPLLGSGAVLAMVASLVGILGIAYSIYTFKFLGRHEILFLPSRLFFVGCLGLTVVPFLLVVFADRIPYVLLLVPTALYFLLYPLLEPHGVLYGQDAIFNFQFASSLLLHPSWVAGANTSGQAVTYSFYPGSGLFNAEGSVFLGIPLTRSFAWTLPTLRLLVLPPLVFALGSRLLGPRAGVLGVVLYLSAPSITLNDIVQQEFAVLFFGLTLLAITFLLYAPEGEATPLRLLVLVFSSYVVLGHHLTSYAMGIWLAGLAVLPLLLWGRPAFAALRSSVVAMRYFIVFLLYVFFLTAAVLLSQLALLEKNILLLLGNAALSAKAAAAGNSYPAYQVAWIVLSLGIVALLAMLALRVTLVGRPRPYLATSLLLATLILLIAFVLFPTGYSFVAIRTTEYSLLFAAPAAAWFLLRGVVPAIDRRVRVSRRAPGGSPRPPRGAWVAPAAAVVLVLFVFTGGNLVPGLSRDQFQPPNLLGVNSPMRITSADFHDGLWARTHLNASEPVWGDLLVYDVYSGIGGLAMPFNTWSLFNGTNLASTNFSRVHVGDYVVTDVFDSRLTPQFYGAGTDQPTGPLPAAQLAKFNDPSYFSVVFADPVFTVYQVTTVP